MATQAPPQEWQLDEAGAAAYERTLVPAFMEPSAHDLVARTGVAEGRDVVDVACGTGVVARAAARAGAQGRVVGIDPNPAMLSVARSSAQAAGLDVRFERGSAEQLPLPDAAADVVLCQHGLPFVAEPAAALREFRRVLRPGGRLGTVTCRPLACQPAGVALVEVLGRHLGPQVAAGAASPYQLGDLDALRALADAAGLSQVTVAIRVWEVRFASPEALLDAETASAPFAGAVRALDPRARQRLVADLSEALAAYADDGGVVFPFSTAHMTAAR